ncbi:hypothetical protein L486_02897 [Kwoniella mangroviensis CBS 10435]|uniref:Uncharacterized protein n=1 Tax=Kwoniella mangroviensis CBS 10435 TaxID=1331196 RepID=A0A1B9IXF4_9TREE|nr:hypothetical protein L486_02897 [Kwoniella mangroviensis CBS 10435]
MFNKLSIVALLLAVSPPALVYASSDRIKINKSSCIGDINVFGDVFKAYCPTYKANDPAYTFKAVYFDAPEGETEQAYAFCTIMMIQSTLLTIFCALLANAKEDQGFNNHDAVLVVKPHCQTIDQFQVNFEKLCPVRIPPPNVTDGFIYSSTTFNRGDWDDNFQRYFASVNCLYVTFGSSKNVGGEIAEALGGLSIDEQW